MWCVQCWLGEGVLCGKWAQKVLPTLGRKMQLKTGNRQALENFRALKHVSSGSFKSSLRTLRVASVCSYAAIMSTERQSNIDRESGKGTGTDTVGGETHMYSAFGNIINQLTRPAGSDVYVANNIIIIKCPAERCLREVCTL